MHYKNGREAKFGDPVICTDYTGKVTTGKIHSIIPGCASCNCTVAEPAMGGVNQIACKTIGDMVHAEDAFNSFMAPTVAQPDPPPDAEGSTIKGANWFVTPEGAGAKNGVDWNNAWAANSVNSACIKAGDRIWSVTISS